MPKDFIEKFNILNKEQENIAKEFEKLYTDIYGYFTNSEESFNCINKIYSINTFKDCISVLFEAECQDPYDDYCNDYELCVDLPLDFFSNYDEYLADKNKKEQENLENKKLKDIDKLKREISDKAEKLYSLTENVYCGDIQTLLEDI